MRRSAFVSTLALFAFGCADQPALTSPPTDGPALAVSDGSVFSEDLMGEAGNARFFWLSPIVPQPKSSEFTEPFDPYVQPSIEICELNDTEPHYCVSAREDLRFEFEAGGIEIEDGTQHYHVNWDLPNSLKKGKFRIHALVGASPDNVLRELGYRDIEIGGAGKADAPFYGVSRGSSIPIKFRIEEGAVCYGEEENCATGTVTSGAGGFTTGFDDAGVFFERNTVDDGVLVTIRFSLIEGPECIAFQNPDRPLDLAHYPDCWKVTTFPEDYHPLLKAPLTFGICYAHDDRMIYESQESHARLYRAEDDGSAVQVMELVAVPQLDCERLDYGLETKNVLDYARNMVKRVLQPLAPTPLVASSAVRHAGLGGRGFASIVGFYMPASLNPNGATDLGVVPVGEALDVAALVMDGGDGFGGASLPVMNSRVWFSPDAGSLFDGFAERKFVRTTGFPDDSLNVENGIARGTWTLKTPGSHKLRVSGLGYAAPPPLGNTEGNDNKPPWTIENLPPWMDEVSTDSSWFEFTAFACSRSADPESVDGTIDENDVYSDSPDYDFSVNISGDPDAEAHLYIANDCKDLFIGLKVAQAGDKKVNSLRIDLANDFGTGEFGDGRDVGDDIVVVDVIDPDLDPNLTDMWMTQRCVGSKQASCGTDDSDPTPDKRGAFGIVDGFWTYEVAIPLSNGSGQDLNVGFGDAIGVSITLQIGNGAQGNTQVPGFKMYFNHEIKP